jgi:hypothetical protein
LIRADCTHDSFRSSRDRIDRGPAAAHARQRKQEVAPPPAATVREAS